MSVADGCDALPSEMRVVGRGMAMPGVPSDSLRDMRARYPEMFKKYCVMHLTLHLDIDCSSLRDIDDNVQRPLPTHLVPPALSCHHRAGPAAPPLSTTQAQREIIHRLKSYLKCSKSEIIPVVFPGDILAPVDKLIDMIDTEEVLSTVGLFRVAGSRLRQQKLEVSLQEGGSVCLSEGECSVFDLCDLLKRFLGKLDQPLLTHTSFPLHCSIADMPRDKAAHKIAALQCLVLLLPSENYRLLWRLLRLLRRVSDHTGSGTGVDNLMNADNLARIFCPHLLMPKHLSSEQMYAVNEVCSRSVAFMIRHVHEIFTVPQDLVVDIENYLREVDSTDGARLKHTESCVKTSIQFADRALSGDDAERAKQTAQFIHTITSMPDSARKKQLMKKMPDESHQRKFLTPEVARCGQALPHHGNKGRHKRSKSGNITLDSIKKKMPFSKSPMPAYAGSSKMTATPKIHINSPLCSSDTKTSRGRRPGRGSLGSSGGGRKAGSAAVPALHPSLPGTTWYEGGGGAVGKTPLGPSSLYNALSPAAAGTVSLLASSPNDIIDLSIMTTAADIMSPGSGDAKRLCVGDAGRPHSPPTPGIGTMVTRSRSRTYAGAGAGKPPSPHYNKVLLDGVRRHQQLSHGGGGGTPVTTTTTSDIHVTPITKSIAIAPKAVKADAAAAVALLSIAYEEPI